MNNATGYANSDPFDGLGDFEISDAAWRKADRFLAEWDASEAAPEMDDDWLNDLRAGWDKRLGDLYGFDIREETPTLW